MSPFMAVALAVMFAVLGFVLRRKGTVNATAFWLFELAALMFLVAAAVPFLRG